MTHSLKPQLFLNSPNVLSQLPSNDQNLIVFFLFVCLFLLESVKTTQDTALWHIEKKGLGPGYGILKGCYFRVKAFTHRGDFFAWLILAKICFSELLFVLLVNSHRTWILHGEKANLLFFGSRLLFPNIRHIRLTNSSSVSLSTKCCLINNTQIIETTALDNIWQSITD